MVGIAIEKVTVNIGVGSPGEPLEKAEKLLLKLTGQKPVRTLSKHRIPTWGIRKNQEIGVKTTLRNQKAMDFLKKALAAKDNKLDERNFDVNGNFAFGISEYIDLPGVKYDPEIGIYGFDVCVTMKRDGYRVAKRKRKKAKIPKKHRTNKKEVMKWAMETLGIGVEGFGKG